MDIVGRITELCKKKGWSKYELAKQSGIAPNTVYAWSRGRQPSLTNIVIICESMDITLEQFFCGMKGLNLTNEENMILQEWFTLSDLEKAAIFSVIEVFKNLKR